IITIAVFSAAVITVSCLLLIKADRELLPLYIKDGWGQALTVENFDEEAACVYIQGERTAKEIKAVNTGPKDVMVRVRIEEFLRLLKNNGPDQYEPKTVWLDTPNNTDDPYVPVVISAEVKDNYVLSRGFAEKDLLTSHLDFVGDETDIEMYKKTAVNGDETKFTLLGFAKIGENLYQSIHEHFVITAEGPDFGKVDVTGVKYRHYEMKAWLPESGFYNRTLQEVHTFPHRTVVEPLPAPFGVKIHDFIEWDLNDGKIRPVSEWAAPADEWYYDDTGWLYYGRPLGGGATTPDILKSVRVSEDYYNLALNMNYKINVRMQYALPETDKITEAWGSGRDFDYEPSNPWAVVTGNCLSDEAKNALEKLVLIP
ncbi:MAG: hypothetical protein FWF08_06340, partial [Oscillospiraceae bacterium]|nr:hypothetical protein [Oscillospiraceae bacterium]